MLAALVVVVSKNGHDEQVSEHVHCVRAHHQSVLLVTKFLEVHQVQQFGALREAVGIGVAVIVIATPGNWVRCWFESVIRVTEVFEAASHRREDEKQGKGHSAH